MREIEEFVAQAEKSIHYLWGWRDRVLDFLDKLSGLSEDQEKEVSVIRDLAAKTYFKKDEPEPTPTPSREDLLDYLTTVNRALETQRAMDALKTIDTATKRMWRTWSDDVPGSGGSGQQSRGIAAPGTGPISKPMSKPEWWPENPYPTDVFPMTVEEYVEAVPDSHVRGAVSGHLARWAWGVAERMIWERMQDNLPEASDEAAPSPSREDLLAFVEKIANGWNDDLTTLARNILLTWPEDAPEPTRPGRAHKIDRMKEATAREIAKPDAPSGEVRGEI